MKRKRPSLVNDTVTLRIPDCSPHGEFVLTVVHDGDRPPEEHRESEVRKRTDERDRYSSGTA
ncbi:hypothetical protein [Haladaptatus caseinilyticus]|uniref:hypothetical protein n=1 Tax=Haladaptatus caseinilyticus TaxID=2993314 RepID=UPI00224B80F2|nr:hypothetical protein [Haladaptatus caseinilyticus]